MRRIRFFFGMTLAAAIVAGCGDSTGPGVVQEGSEWTGQVSVGNTIEIKGVIGDIQAYLTAEPEVTVSWIKEGHRDDPSEVRVEVVDHAGGVTICAVYPDVGGRPANECRPGLSGNMSTGDNDVEVNFIVWVPVGVHFTGRTVTGDVEAVEIRGDAYGITVTGDVNLSTTGIAEATTVTGSINASIGEADWGRDLHFTTVTGSVWVRVPAATNAEVRATTVTGSISSDFGLHEISEGTARGTIGNGGPMLMLTTVTGSIALRRGS